MGGLVAQGGWTQNYSAITELLLPETSMDG
jgi:hypothetical protein